MRKHWWLIVYRKDGRSLGGAIGRRRVAYSIKSRYNNPERYKVIKVVPENSK